MVQRVVGKDGFAGLACAVSLAMALFASPGATAQPAAGGASSAGAPAAKLSEHVKKDIERHRAMAAAHEGAARCLAAGKTESTCLTELQAACKGLAIGKYCGMKHEH